MIAFKIPNTIEVPNIVMPPKAAQKWEVFILKLRFRARSARARKNESTYDRVGKFFLTQI